MLFDSPLHTVVLSLLLALLCVMTFSVISLRRSRKKLARSEQHLKLTLEGSGDILWDWYIKTGEVKRVNDEHANHSKTT